MSSPWKTDTKKYALIGSACGGKTTTAYGVLAKLKANGISCDGVMQQDRRINFDLAKLIDDKTGRLGRYHVICNQILREVEMTMKDFKILVSDRSPFDLYAYYEEQFGRTQVLLDMVDDWCARTFEKLFYFQPLPYKDDQQRPPEDIRDNIDKVLKNLIQNCSNHLAPKIITMPYGTTAQYVDFVYSTIQGYDVSVRPRMLTENDLKQIPSLLRCTEVLISGSYAKGKATAFSDVDVTILGPSMMSVDHPYMRENAAYIEHVLSVKAEVRQVTLEIYAYLKTEFKTVKG